jgi:quercetin dioxygenase-like cupin family protein
MSTDNDHSGPGSSDHEADTRVVTLEAKAEELLTQARSHSSRRASETLVGGPVMRATLIALAEGSELGAHDAPPAATLQAVTGRVTVNGADRTWPVGPGELVTIPQERHSMTADTDAVVLLTVALHGTPAGG